MILLKCLEKFKSEIIDTHSLAEAKNVILSLHCDITHIISEPFLALRQPVRSLSVYGSGVRDMKTFGSP